MIGLTNSQVALDSVAILACAGLGLALLWVARSSAMRPGSHRLGIATALLALYSFVALSQLDSLLRAMHTPDRAAAGMQAITGLGSSIASSEVMRETVHVWQAWRASYPFGDAPTTIVDWFLLLDCSFIVFYSIATIVLLESGRTLNVGVQNVVDDDDEAGILATQERLAGIAVVLVPILAATDLFEDLLTRQLIREAAQAPTLHANSPSSFTVALLHRVTDLKWALVVAIIVLAFPLALGLVVAFRNSGVHHAVLRARAIVGVITLSGLLLLIRLQVPDVIRRWDTRQAAFAVVLAFSLGVIAYGFARLVIWANRALNAVTTKALFVGSVTFLFAGGLSLFFHTGLPGLIIAGGILLCLSVFNVMAPSQNPEAPPPACSGRGSLPRLLAVAPLLVLGLAALKALLADTVEGHANAGWGIGVLLAWGLVPVLAACGLYFILERYEISTATMIHRVGRGVFIAAGLVCVAVAFYVTLDVWSASRILGAVTLVEASMGVAAVIFGAATLWIERTAPPRFLATFGLRRTPLFVLLLVWLVFANLTPDRGYHDVRLLDNALAARPRLTAVQAWTRWRNEQLTTGEQSPGERQAVPMIFVATSGGGIKAAVWTSFVLDCVFRGGDAVESPESKKTCAAADPSSNDRTSSIFAASGISGGSLGLVEYTTHEVVSGSDPDPGWIQRVMGEDFVSPNLGWQLFVEVPRALLRFDPGMDRAEVLERGFEQAWGSAAPIGEAVGGPLANGFLDQQFSHPEIPFLILNGATVGGGCRFVTSVLSTAGDLDPNQCSHVGALVSDAPDAASGGLIFPASQDLMAVLACQNGDGSMDDVRLSTAALLSARFPYVSPSAHLNSCGPTLQVVDGGYLDGSGGASAKELWDAVAPEVNAWNADETNSVCIVPYLLQIDSGYEDATGAKPLRAVSEPRVPPTANSQARGSRSVEGRNEAALAFQQSLPNLSRSDRYAIVYLHSHPGSEAPLGWTMSSGSVNDLDAQLSLNDGELREVANWFAPAGCP